MIDSEVQAAGPKKQGRMLNLFIGALLIAVICMMVAQGMHEANVKAELRIAVREAKSLEEGLQVYRQRNGNYPHPYNAPAFDEMTLDPLRRRGYYSGPLTSALLNGRLDAYHAPEDQGNDQEYWVEMTLQSDPSIRILVARSDDAPIGGGRWLEGVYVFRQGKLKQV
jgi:hypothetical protein